MINFIICIEKRFLVGQGPIAGPCKKCFTISFRLCSVGERCSRRWCWTAMEKPSSSRKSSTRVKASSDVNTSLSMLNEDLLQNILARLPALPFASAACVSKAWNSLCNRILSRPKLSSALSLNPSLPVRLFLSHNFHI